MAGADDMLGHDFPEEGFPGEESPDSDGAGAERLKKAPHAYRTISEVADDLHVPQHVLRFWETRFPEVKPLKRAGGRRYYRPEDIDILRRIADLLYVQGYTIKGVQRVLREGETVSDRPGSATSPTESVEVAVAAASEEDLSDLAPEDPVQVAAPEVTEIAIVASPFAVPEVVSLTPAFSEVTAIEEDRAAAEESEHALNLALAEKNHEVETMRQALEDLRHERNYLRGELRGILQELDGIRQLLPI